MNPWRVVAVCIGAWVALWLAMFGMEWTVFTHWKD